MVQQAEDTEMDFIQEKKNSGFISTECFVFGTQEQKHWNERGTYAFADKHGPAAPYRYIT